MKKNMVAEEEASTLLKYRDALADGDRQVFDRLVNCAKTHVGACAQANKLTLFESMLLAMVLEQPKKIVSMTMGNPLAGLENV